MVEIILLGFEEEAAFRPFMQEMEKKYGVKLRYPQRRSSFQLILTSHDVQ